MMSCEGLCAYVGKIRESLNLSLLANFEVMLKRGARDLINECKEHLKNFNYFDEDCVRKKYFWQACITDLEALIKYANRYAGYDYEYTLGKDEYFVVGDNRANSHDSRDWNDSNPDNDVGPITEDMLVGKVRCVFWPLSAIRGVK